MTWVFQKILTKFVSLGHRDLNGDSGLLGKVIQVHYLDRRGICHKDDSSIDTP